MIITRQKNLEEIIVMLQGSEKVAIIGCGGCVTFYKTGGRKQTIEMAEKLREKGIDVVATGISARQCYLIEEKEAEALDDSEIIKKVARNIVGLEEAEGIDAVVSLACGVGVQNLANLIDTPVYPAQNTLFMGRRRVEGDFDIEQCIGCGDCVLGYTAGICPVTRCAKSLMNGPCGGVFNGNCEVSQSRVSEYDIPCAWIQIYEKLKANGKLDNMRRIFPEKDFIRATHMRKVEVAK